MILQHQSAHPTALRKSRNVDRINRPRRAIRSHVDVNINRASQRVLLREPRSSDTKHQAKNNRLQHL